MAVKLTMIAGAVALSAGLASAAAAKTAPAPQDGRPPAIPSDCVAPVPDTVGDVDVRDIVVTELPRKFGVNACLAADRATIAWVRPTFALFDRRGTLLGAMGQPRMFDKRPLPGGGGAYHCSGVEITRQTAQVADLFPFALVMLAWSETSAPSAYTARTAWLPLRLKADARPQPCSGPVAVVRDEAPSEPEASLPEARPETELAADIGPSASPCLAPKTSTRAIEVRDLRVTYIPVDPRLPGKYRLGVSACAVSNDVTLSGIQLNFRVALRDGSQSFSAGQKVLLAPAAPPAPLPAPATVAALAAEIQIPLSVATADLRPVLVVDAIGSGPATRFEVPYLIER